MISPRAAVLVAYGHSQRSAALFTLPSPPTTTAMPQTRSNGKETIGTDTIMGFVDVLDLVRMPSPSYFHFPFSRTFFAPLPPPVLSLIAVVQCVSLSRMYPLLASLNIICSSCSYRMGSRSEAPEACLHRLINDGGTCFLEEESQRCVDQDIQKWTLKLIG